MVDMWELTINAIVLVGSGVLARVLLLIPTELQSCAHRLARFLSRFFLKMNLPSLRTGEEWRALPALGLGMSGEELTAPSISWVLVSRRTNSTQLTSLIYRPGGEGRDSVPVARPNRSGRGAV